MRFDCLMHNIYLAFLCVMFIDPIGACSLVDFKVDFQVNLRLKYIIYKKILGIR